MGRRVGGKAGRWEDWQVERRTCSMAGMWEGG